MDFQERQKQIYELSSFISEQEKWLEGVLGKLQWTKEYLSSVSEVNQNLRMWYRPFTNHPTYPQPRLTLTWSNVPTTPITMFPARLWRGTRPGAGTAARGSRWTGRLLKHWHPQVPSMAAGPISLTYTSVCPIFKACVL